MRNANDPQEYQFVQHKRQLIPWLRYFYISLNSTCFKIKIITRNIVFMKITPQIGRCIRIGRRLHVNQPLQGRIARAFSSNSFVNTMDMTAAIKYILTAAQSLGSQDYYRKSRMTILGLAGLLFCENDQA